jgi:hypothetical protein
MGPREIGLVGVDIMNMAQDVGKFQVFVKEVKKCAVKCL